jgi:hypothetical protein
MIWQDLDHTFQQLNKYIIVVCDERLFHWDKQNQAMSVSTHKMFKVWY